MKNWTGKTGQSGPQGPIDHASEPKRRILFVSELGRSYKDNLKVELDLAGSEVTDFFSVDDALNEFRANPQQYDAVVTELEMGHGSLGAERTMILQV